MANVTITKTSNVPGQTIEVTVPQEIASPEPDQGHSVPSVHNIALIAVLAAVVAWGIVQVVKTGVKGYRSSKKKKGSPWWLSASLRGLSIGVGALAGWLLFDPMGADGVKYLSLIHI